MAVAFHAPTPRPLWVVTSSSPRWGGDCPVSGTFQNLCPSWRVRPSGGRWPVGFKGREGTFPCQSPGSVPRTWLTVIFRGHDPVACPCNRGSSWQGGAAAGKGADWQGPGPRGTPSVLSLDTPPKCLLLESVPRVSFRASAHRGTCPEPLAPPAISPFGFGVIGTRWGLLSPG